MPAIAGLDTSAPGMVSSVTPSELPTFLREYADAAAAHLAILTAAAAELSDSLTSSAARSLDLGIRGNHCRGPAERSATGPGQTVTDSLVLGLTAPYAASTVPSVELPHSACLFR